MRVLLTTQVFPPEVHPTGVMVEQLADHLAARGDDAVVAAGYPHHPHGALFGGYRKQPLLREVRATYTVVRGWHLTSRSGRTLDRALVMISQTLGTVWAGWAARRRDVVVNFGPPLIGPFFSALLARSRRARFVPVIYDLYPDIAIETGKVRNRVVIWAARWIERFMYRSAHRIVVLSEGFRNALVARGVPASKVEVVPVWLDAREITPSPRVNAWRREAKIAPEKQVVLYAGTIGLVSGAGILVDVAEAFGDRPDVLFLFVGEGRVKDEIEVEAGRRALRNVQFLPFQPRARLNEIQAIADVSVVTLAPGRGRTSVPSKVVGYMAAGRPIVACVDGDSDTAAAVRDAGCGIVTTPGDPRALGAAIATLLDDPARREAMGRAARMTFERTYSKDAALAKMTRILEGGPSEEMEDAMRARAATLKVRPMGAGDVARVVELHLAAFRGFFLSFLGPRFLRLFYSSAVALGEIALVSESDGRVVGFVMGSTSPGRFFKQLLRTRLFAFALSAAPAVLRRPAIAGRVARGLVKPKEAAKPARVATLMSLGVDPTAQGLGAGKALVGAFLQEAGNRGSNTVDLTTDKVDNERTNAFYRGLGFRVAREIVTPERRVLNEYEIDLPAR